MVSGTFTAPGQTSGTYAVGTGTRLHVALEGFVAKVIIVAELSTDSGATWGFVREYLEIPATHVVTGLPPCTYRLRCTYLDSGSVDWNLSS